MRSLPILLLLVSGCGNHQLPAAAPAARVDPGFAHPPEMEVCWLEFGRVSGPGAFATAGKTDAKKFDGTMSGIFVRHPQGDVLIDAGNSSAIQTEIKALGFVDRQVLKRAAAGASVIAKPGDAIKKVGGDPASLKHVIVSHAHLDHLGGLVDLPGVSVLMAQDEIDFIKAEAKPGSRHAFPGHAKAIEGRVEAIPFTKTPYQTFSESYDLFGDGSVVLVKLPGHTPGSVGTFVNLSSKKRVFHVGDAVFLEEGVDKRVPKGIVMRRLDFDHEKANTVVAKLSQLREMDPKLLIVPAHDRPAWIKAFGNEPGFCGREVK